MKKKPPTANLLQISLPMLNSLAYLHTCPFCDIVDLSMFFQYSFLSSSSSPWIHYFISLIILKFTILYH